MNKEVEEAKEYFEELIKGYEQDLKEIEDFDEYEEEQKFIKRRVSKLKILLNYIKELEETQCTHNIDNACMSKQTIRDKIEELANEANYKNDAYTLNTNIRKIQVLQELLNKEE